jgi:hypothetical protein
VSNLQETFDILQQYSIQLNPEKCVFSVPVGKLLGFIVSQRGTEANPAKNEALSKLKVPTKLQDIQRLAGCVTAFSRFISCLGEKALPLYKLLKKTKDFKWTKEAAAALEEIKTLLAGNPILAAPGLNEPMLLYILATNQVVSAVLVVERAMEGHKLQVQRPMYYVSEVITPCKTRYPHYQKMAYALFKASRKL